METIVSFPWELQIWEASHEKQNTEAHAAHDEKRRYTNWANAYKKGNIEEGEL